MTIHRLRGERGMTLIELMLALLVFSAVLGGALAFLRAQARTFSLGNERLGMVQNARFALNTLEKDLRTAGAANPDEQPPLIYAGTSVVAFNGNYITNVKDDIFAVYYNPDAPSGTVAALTKAERLTIPQTSFAYPDTSYYMDPMRTINSPSETIIFFFVADTSTSRPDDYALYRQVNAEASELLARNLLAVPGVPFFRYQRILAGALGPTGLQEVPAAQLPLVHTERVHLALTDTGPVSRIDSVRAVHVTFTATNGLSGPSERQRTISRLIRLPNAGLRTKKTCGDEPLLGAGIAFTAVYAPLAGGEPAVNLSWNRSQDDGGGEQDVVRYVIWRRLNTEIWPDVEAYISIPAGEVNYVFTDAAVVPGSTYVYGLAAQDCTPLTSNLTESLPVVIP